MPSPLPAFRDADELLPPAEPAPARRAALIEQLCAASDGRLPRGNGRAGRHVLPSRRGAREIVSDVLGLVFPWHFGPPDLTSATLRSHVVLRVEQLRASLGEQIGLSLVLDCEHEPAERRSACSRCRERTRDTTEAAVAGLPRLRALLETDLDAAYEGDPAVRSLDEVLACHPGVRALVHHRFAHELFRAGVPLLPRLLSELAHADTGIDIHPGAELGEALFIDHGTGVVIGETCSVGQRVRIYQGVTLGSPGTDDQERLLRGIPRHPIVEDDVVIHAGATILGRVTLGRGAVVGGNVWLTRSVAPFGRVTQSHVRHRSFRDGAGI